MRKVKGNTPVVMQIQGEARLNAIGEAEIEWIEKMTFFGVLGLQSGDSKYSNYNAKIEESTHCLICDYNPEIYALADDNVRCIIKGRTYDVLLIDNPDELNEHLEIYLRFVGGQNGL